MKSQIGNASVQGGMWWKSIKRSEQNFQRKLVSVGDFFIPIAFPWLHFSLSSFYLHSSLVQWICSCL